MKFLCPCNYQFIDQTDDLPYKGYIYPDQSRETLYDAIDNIFDNKKPADELEFDRMISDIVLPIGGRTIYQCPECGRIHIKEDNGRISSFAPESKLSSKNLLQVKK